MLQVLLFGRGFDSPHLHSPFDTARKCRFRAVFVDSHPLKSTQSTGIDCMLDVFWMFFPAFNFRYTGFLVITAPPAPSAVTSG